MGFGCVLAFSYSTRPCVVLPSNGVLLHCVLDTPVVDVCLLRFPFLCCLDGIDQRLQSVTVCTSQFQIRFCKFRCIELRLNLCILSIFCIRWVACLTHCDCCLLYTSPSPRDRTRSRMPSSA
eukprot:TRINITY_DN12856_c0_g1_i2.p1 TRINITY_DN12856_c0_g1~~TRINITY_DN12856_c0_g1_i2.p1  ORF type:complete len:122 (+),score=9.58 TRINITY_DN12856_c0_g1_i2:75-440(+)